MYQVLARKWRPRNFDELVGQVHVARTIRNSIEAKRVAHAYLFAGLRGTGKTTVARILAKCLNCEKGPTPTPCDACEPCLEITAGRALDVLEMDAASRTGVDDIRELQEVVAYAPARDRYKVLIIDEAHMLSKQAFNALLKTLEEPPPRVVFVLATTELQKVLPTILSRCQVFEFRRVMPAEVAAHLRKVCESEGVRVSAAVLDRIARAGEGSVRDSLSLLERVLAFGGEAVSEEDARNVLGALRTEALADLIRGLARRDAAGMLGVLDGVLAEGHDLVHVWAELIAVLRDLMLLRTLPDRHDLLTRSPEEAAALESASEGLSREDLTRAFHLVAELEYGLKGSSQPRFLFESALIRLADLGSVRPIEEILSGLGRPEEKKKVPEPAPAREPAPAPRRPLPPEGALTRFRSLVHDAKPMLDAMLDQAAAVELSEGVLEIAFAARAETIRRQVGRSEHLAILREALSSVVPGAIEIRVLEADAASAPRERPDPAPDVGEADAPSPAARGVSSKERELLLDRAREEPGVAKLLTEFGGQVVDIRVLGERIEEAP